MSKAMIVMEQNIRTFHFENEDYICITDIAKIKIEQSKF